MFSSFGMLRVRAHYDALVRKFEVRRFHPSLERVNHESPQLFHGNDNNTCSSNKDL